MDSSNMDRALVHSKQISHALCLCLSNVLPDGLLRSPILEKFTFGQEKCLKYEKIFTQTSSPNTTHTKYLEKG